MYEYQNWNKVDQVMSQVSSGNIETPSLRIAVCPPDFHTLRRVIKGEIADTTFIIQTYIYEGLQNKGHKLDFFGPCYPEEVVFTDNIMNPTPTRRTWSGSRLFETASKLVWKLQQLLRVPYLNVFSNLRLLDAGLQCLPGHDIVYERNHLHKFGIALACKRLRIPYVLYFEADDIQEHDIMKKPITGLLRLQAAYAIRINLNTADRIICVSEPLKTHLQKKWKVPAEKIVVFPNVADIRRFQPNLEARKQIRDTFGLGDCPLIIFVGNFYEWHDVATLLKAFAKIIENYPDARLLLVGDGAKRLSMAQLAMELGIDQKVLFTGMVAHTEVPRFMAAADIAVVPYPVLKQDVWLSPLKLFEYMASGNAIIASNVGQLSEWVENERNGLLVPPGDVPALAAGVERLIADPGLQLRLGQNAREDAWHKHSWDKYLTDLEALFNSMLVEGKN